MTYPHAVWLQPTRRGTRRCMLHRSTTECVQVWELHTAGADDYAGGVPVVPGAVLLTWLAGGECVTTAHDSVEAATEHAEAVLRARGWIP